MFPRHILGQCLKNHLHYNAYSWKVYCVRSRRTHSARSFVVQETKRYKRNNGMLQNKAILFFFLTNAFLGHLGHRKWHGASSPQGPTHLTLVSCEPVSGFKLVPPGPRLCSPSRTFYDSFTTYIILN